jgi:hypothetical protein
MLEGLRLGATLMAVVLAMVTLNTLGVGAAAGVDLGMAGADKPLVAETAGDLQDPQASAVGQDDPTFFGVGVGITRTAQQLYVLLAKTGPILSSWGIPPVIATSIQLMVDLTFAISIMQILRGVVWR